MTKGAVSVDDLLSVLRLDAETGVLYWLPRPLSMFENGMKNDMIGKAWNAKHANKAALNSISQGYRGGTIFGRTMKAHRVVFAMHYGKWPEGEIDHINGIKTDNRISNLRDATHQQNMKNMRRKTLPKSGFSGVYWNQNRWNASIMANGKIIYLGSFTDRELAIAARSKALIEHSYDENHCKSAA